VRELIGTAFHYYRHPGESRDLRAFCPEDSGLRRNDDDFSLRPLPLCVEKHHYVLKADYSAFV
jgi:hypothetical protein